MRGSNIISLMVSSQAPSPLLNTKPPVLQATMLQGCRENVRGKNHPMHALCGSCTVPPFVQMNCLVVCRLSVRMINTTEAQPLLCPNACHKKIIYQIDTVKKETEVTSFDGSTVWIVRVIRLDNSFLQSPSLDNYVSV